MTVRSETAWQRFKLWLSTAADVVSIAAVFGGTSTAAFVSSRLDSRRLTRVFIVIAAASAVALLIFVLRHFVRWVRYRFFSVTKVEIIGGHSLTLVIQHRGLPVKVRARAEFLEFGEDMERHPAPYDLQLFTRTHGGRYDLIELNESFDMAKSVFGELTSLGKDAAEFRVERPGFSPFLAVAQETRSELPSVLAYLNVTVTVISPVYLKRITKRYRLYVRHDNIKVVDDTATAQ
jgi:hypothetical protein